MNEYAGIVCIVDLYNFINSNLLKNDVIFRRNDDFIEITQDGNWTRLPDFLNNVMLIPKGFRVGKVTKSDLIKLYDKLSFIAQIKGQVPLSYSNSFISPTLFGFKVWSKYPYNGIPGVKYVDEFKFNVKYSWIYRILHKLK